MSKQIDITNQEFKTWISKEFLGYGNWKCECKLLCYDVGVDRFGYAFHPELLTLADNMIIQHGLFNKD